MKDHLVMASQFAQTLLNRLPDCYDTNPVKMAFSITKVIIEIKDVGFVSASSAQADHYIRQSETTKKGLYNVSMKQRTDSSLRTLWRRWSAVFRRPAKRPWRGSNRTSSILHRKDIIKNMLLSRILWKEMKELEDLANNLLATQVIDDEEYGPKIQQIFQRVKEAAISFLVRIIIFV